MAVSLQLLLAILLLCRGEELSDPIIGIEDSIAKLQTIKMLNRDKSEAFWISHLSSSIKTLNHLNTTGGQATYRFRRSNDSNNSYSMIADIDLKDPYYIDKNVVTCQLKLQISMFDYATLDWKANNQSVIFQLKYKRKEIRRIESICDYVVNETYLHINCQNQFSVVVTFHQQTEYLYLCFVLMIPAQILLQASRNIQRSNFPIQHISVTAVFFSLTFVLFISIMQLLRGLLDMGGGNLRYLVICGLFTFTSFRIAQASLIDRLDRPRQQIWYFIFMLIYLNLLSNLATEDWFLLLQSLVLTPQIIHNVINLSRARFDWNYITCLLIGHFYLFYYKGIPYNLMKNSPDYTMCSVMITLIVLQLIILYYQSKKSTRYFLPKWLIPGYHNYHQEVIIGPSRGINIGQCSICLLDLTEEQQSVSSVVTTQTNLQVEKVISIMSTPCKHKFHGDCLTTWMDKRMRCPVCRSNLPPLED